MFRAKSSREIVTILEKHGFTLKSQRGSHSKYTNGSATVIVPHPRKEIPHGTFQSIVRQSGLGKEAFE